MAGEQHDPGQVQQEPGQHLDGVVVEVVGRLVEQQASGPRGHHRRERQPGALPAGQRADGAPGVERRRARVAAATSARRSASQASWATAPRARSVRRRARPRSCRSPASRSTRRRRRAAGAASPRGPRRWCGRRGTAAPGRAAPGRPAPRRCPPRGRTPAVGARPPSAASTCRCRSRRPGRSGAPAGRRGRPR